MNRSSILRMANEADLWMTSDERITAVERFANLVEAAERARCYDLIETLVKAEREACARMAEDCVDIERLADAIRARKEK